MKAILFDTETTDLIHARARQLAQQPYVVELAAVKLELVDSAWLELGTYDKIIRPGVPMSADAARITGLTDDKLADAPRFTELAGEIREFMQDADMVVAHNLSFDMQMLDIEFRRVGQPLVWPPKKTCTVEATEHLLGRRMKLIELHEHLFGEGFAAAHRAMNDVRALERVFIELFNRGIV